MNVQGTSDVEEGERLRGAGTGRAEGTDRTGAGTETVRNGWTGETGGERKKGRRSVPCRLWHLSGGTGGPGHCRAVVERCSDQVSAGSAWCASTLSMLSMILS
ncbi:hypothetical protein GCM10010348_62650 [Streptomyces anthocyanicus]|nr:hypothetical protein GCM10010348_62650 [Streptomyces anthocyanicus]